MIVVKKGPPRETVTAKAKVSWKRLHPEPEHENQLGTSVCGLFAMAKSW